MAPTRIRTDGLATIALGVAFVGLVVAALGGHLGWFMVAAVVSYLADALLADTTWSALLRRHQLGLTFRFTLRELLLVVLFAQHGHSSAWAITALLIGLALVHVIRMAELYLFLRTRRLRRGLVRWANLDVDGAREAPVPLRMVGPAWPGLAGTRLPLHFDLVLFVAVIAAWHHTGAPLLVAVIALAVAGAVVIRAGLRQYTTERAQPRPIERNARLHEVLTELAPEIVVYFSSAVTSTYALNVWLETIDRFDRPTIIFLRELGHLGNLGPTRTPIVVLPTARLVEQFRVPSVRVALYPTTVIKNNHMLRLTGIRHIFINHGDGDKSVTYSTLHRAFDEVWVAGQAARDRYLNNHVGVRDEQIRLVGRPQLAHIDRTTAPAQPPFTVLYAPTWEGNFDGADYSSVATMGVAIMSALLRSPLPIRVLLKPHPATGQRSAAARAARAKIERMVIDAGAPNRLVDVGPEALYEAFNQSDLLVADVSSVVADYLASRKPYIVTNPKGMDPELRRAELPSTSGGYEVGIDLAGVDLAGFDLAGFEAVVADALGPDSLRGRRDELSTYFLGADIPDPIGHFVGLVDDAVRSQSRLDAGARHETVDAGALPGRIGPDIATVVP